MIRRHLNPPDTENRPPELRLRLRALVLGFAAAVCLASPVGAADEKPSIPGAEWRTNKRGWVCHCSRPVRAPDGETIATRRGVLKESFTRKLCVTNAEATELCNQRYTFGEGNERVKCLVLRARDCAPEFSCRAENRACSDDWCNCGARIEVRRETAEEPLEPGSEVKIGETLRVTVHRPTDQGTTFRDPDRAWLWKGTGDSPPKSREEAVSGCVSFDWEKDRDPEVHPDEKTACVKGADPETQTRFVIDGAYAKPGKKTIHADLDNWFSGAEDCKYRCRAEATFALTVVP